MSAPNKHSHKADIIVALTSICVGAAVWYSVTRDQGYFSSLNPNGPDAARHNALDQLQGLRKEGGKPLSDKSLAPEINKAYQLFELGTTEDRAGQRKAAIEHFKQACKLDPVRKIYWAALGNCYLFEEQLEPALAAFQEVYSRDVYDTFNLTNLGYVSQSLRRDEDARRYYLMALSIKPDLQSAWAEMYNVARGLGLQKYYEVLKQASVTPTDLENGGLVYRLNQDALAEHPDDYFYLVNRALMNTRFMRLTDVQTDINKALQIKKNGTAALLVQAQLYNNMGEVEKAAEAYNACLAVSPQPVAFAELGAIEMKKGNLDQALHDYGKATELGNDKPSWLATYNDLRKQKNERDANAPNVAGAK